MHLDIKLWLDHLKLSQYQSLFDRFNGVQDILQMDEAAIKDEIGIKNSAHRAKIVSSLFLLRTKSNLKLRQQQQQMLGTSDQRYSFAENPSRSRLLEFAAHNKSQSQSTSALNISRMQDYTVIGSAEVTEAATLRKELERELSGDRRRLESHSWYHGSIPRQHAEGVLKKDGQFLIRDSTSGQPGDLVLSLYWKGVHLHFIISKVIVQPDTVYEALQYRLEDEPFDSVPDLVTYYVGSGKPITAATGAKIETPVNRTQPLSHYSRRYGPSSQQNKHPSPAGINQSLYSGQNALAAGRVRMVHPTAREFSTQSLPRPSSDRLSRRRPSDPSLSNNETPSSVPPKPSRIPSQIYPDHKDLGQISENGTEAEENRDFFPSAHHAVTLPRLRKAKTLEQRPVSDTRDSFLDRRSSCDLEAEATFIHSPKDPSPIIDDDRDVLFRPFPSLFDLDNFQTVLLHSTENKPLDMKTLESMSIVFDAHSAKSIALHLLHNDLDILGGLNPALDNTLFRYQSHYVGRGVTSGIELCTLPNGEQLRLDLMERTQCLRLFVAVTILTCPSIEDRAAMLSQWIEIAIESKTALGNMYGFAGLMYGLCMPQIQRLNATWNLLRQRHTSAAYTFEARLKPQAKSEVVPHAPNTTIPDLHSAILLWEATMDSFLEDGVLMPRFNLHLGTAGPDFGMDVLAGHMDLVRSWSLNLPLYLRNSRKAMGQIQLDETLADMLRTEFHMKFLWGSRGASADCEQRYSKFEQVLTALSERCEPSVSAESEKGDQ